MIVACCEICRNNRGNFRGLLRTSVLIAAYWRIAVSMAPDDRGRMCELMSGRPRRRPWQFSRTSAYFRGDLLVLEGCCGNDRGCPRKLPRQCSPKLPRKFPPTSVGCHGWYDGVSDGHNRGHCRGYTSDIFRGLAMNQGTCRGNPRISTVAHGKTYGIPRKFHSHRRILQ